MTDVAIIAIIASLFTYAIVVSQPLMYVVVLTEAQLALSAPAFIELRQRINPVMTKRIPLIYLSAFVTVLWVIVLSVRSGGSLLVTSSVALLCLVVDVAFMLRENVPINGVIDRWSTTDYPENWDDYRRKWFAIFRYRQIALLVGFAGLLIGAVVR